MKRMYIIITALFLGTAFSRAQDTQSNAFGVHLGYGNLKKQDLIFSPFVASDWSPVNVQLKYEHDGKLRQNANIRFGQFKYFVGDPFSYYESGIEYAKFPHSYTNLDLNYSLSKRIHHANRWTVSAGARVRNRFQIANFEFGHAGQFSYHLASGLDGMVNVEYQSGKHTITSDFYIMLFSYLARSPYTGQDDDYLERIMVHKDLKIFVEHLKTGTIQSWGTSRMMDVDLSYRYALNSSWDIGISYIFSMNLHDSPVSYTSIENIVYLGATLKF